MLIECFDAEPKALLLLLFVVSLLLLVVKNFLHNVISDRSKLPIENRGLLFEPRYLAKLRFAFNSRAIFDRAYEKARATPA